MPGDRPALTTNNSASVGFPILKPNNLESYFGGMSRLVFLKS